MKINYLFLISVLVFTNGCAMQSTKDQKTTSKYQPPPPSFTEKKGAPGVILITSDRPEWAEDDGYDVVTYNYVDNEVEKTDDDVDNDEGITAGDVGKACLVVVGVVVVTLAKLAVAMLKVVGQLAG